MPSPGISFGDLMVFIAFLVATATEFMNRAMRLIPIIHLEREVNAVFSLPAKEGKARAAREVFSSESASSPRPSPPSAGGEAASSHAPKAGGE